MTRRLDARTCEESNDLVENRQSAKIILEKLRDDNQALQLARQHSFFAAGLDLVTEDLSRLEGARL